MAIPENVSCAMIEPVKITEMQRCCEKNQQHWSWGIAGATGAGRILTSTIRIQCSQLKPWQVGFYC